MCGLSYLFGLVLVPNIKQLEFQDGNSNYTQIISSISSENFCLLLLSTGYVIESIGALFFMIKTDKRLFRFELAYSR